MVDPLCQYTWESSWQPSIPFSSLEIDAKIIKNHAIWKHPFLLTNPTIYWLP